MPRRMARAGSSGVERTLCNGQTVGGQPHEVGKRAAGINADPVHADVLASGRWRDGDAVMLQAFTQTPDEAVRTGCVPVRAERVDLQRDFAAVDRSHLALLHHRDRTPHDEIRIVDDCPLTRPRRQ